MMHTERPDPAPEYFPRVQLTVQGNILVAIVGIPPFQTLPSVIVWGNRTFMHTHSTTEHKKYGTIPIFNECFSYTVPHDPDPA
jgi:hypothetical protein